jgi:hypothetical protein
LDAVGDGDGVAAAAADADLVAGDACCPAAPAVVAQAASNPAASAMAHGPLTIGHPR